MWPPRHLLRTIEAVSIPHRQSGASSRAREAHGVQPNSHHDPSSRGARDVAESAFQLIFREGSRWRFPGSGKGLISNPPGRRPTGTAKTLPRSTATAAVRESSGRAETLRLRNGPYVMHQF